MFCWDRSCDSWRDSENRLGLSPRPATPLVTYWVKELKKLILHVPPSSIYTALLLVLLFDSPLALNITHSLFLSAAGNKLADLRVGVSLYTCYYFCALLLLYLHINDFCGGTRITFKVDCQLGSTVAMVIARKSLSLLVECP